MFGLCFFLSSAEVSFLVLRIAPPVGRWFRCGLFVIVWFGVGLSRLALVLVVCGGFVLFSFVQRLLLVDPGKNFKKLRCKLAVSK